MPRNIGWWRYLISLTGRGKDQGKVSRAAQVCLVSVKSGFKVGAVTICTNERFLALVITTAWLQALMRGPAVI